MRHCLVAARAVMIVGLSWPAAGHAAQVRLDNVQGRVLVDKGNGFVRVGEGIGLRPGDRIQVTTGGSADFFYDETCQIVLGPGASLTVPEVSPCTEPSRRLRVWLGIGGAAIGAAVGIAVLSDDDDDKDVPLSP